MSSKIAQRTIPESINAKQIFDQNGLGDLKWIETDIFFPGLRNAQLILVIMKF